MFTFAFTKYVSYYMINYVILLMWQGKYMLSYLIKYMNSQVSGLISSSRFDMALTWIKMKGR